MMLIDAVAGDLDRFVAFVGWLRLVRLPLFLPFPDVSTECADNHVGFVAMSKQPRCTRRIDTREQNTAYIMSNVFELVIAAYEAMPLFGHLECVNSPSLTYRLLISSSNS